MDRRPVIRRGTCLNFFSVKKIKFKRAEKNSMTPRHRKKSKITKSIKVVKTHK